MLESLRNDHNELQALLKAAGQIADGGQAARGPALGILRWTLKRLLSRHLAFLEAVVFPAALKAAPPAKAAMVRRLAEETKVLAEDYQRHLATYQGRSESLQREDYQLSVQNLVRQTQRLILLEQSELYPLLPGVTNPLPNIGSAKGASLAGHEHHF